MKVSELIAELQCLPQDLLVVKQRDDEGNGYQKLYAVDADCFVDTDEIDTYAFDVVTLADIKDIDGFTQVVVVC